MSDFYHSREPTFLQRVILTKAGISKGELDAHADGAYSTPKPLSARPPDSHWTYERAYRIGAGDARKLYESLGLNIEDEVCDKALPGASSPSDSCVSSELTPVGDVHGLDVGPSDAPTSAGELSGLVHRALALLDTNVDSSAKPASTDDYVELCRPSKTSIPVDHPPADHPPADHSPADHPPAACPPAAYPPAPIDPSHLLRRSVRIGTRAVARAETPLSTHLPTAAKASSKGKGKAKGTARPSKASTSIPGPSKANGKKARARPEATTGSDEENVPTSSQPATRRLPKRRSSDDDDEEYVEHPAKRQKMEPAAVPAAAKAEKTRKPQIRRDVLEGLVVGEVRGPCPWPNCKWQLVGTRHSLLVVHFETHVNDGSVFTSGDKFKCPACKKGIRGSAFTEHVLEKHLGAEWRCLLWDYEGVNCTWTGGRRCRIAQHYGPTHPELLHILEEARGV
ncbi:hypothetical protein LXA43DRAFT_30715 [Ganoderma leucocontextum]|nr:hypothetical protein LXA43DRAFT_30715 [Ganoderma leucocontextum]